MAEENKNRVKRGLRRCRDCGYTIRGKNHTEGMHHKKPNTLLLGRIDR